MSDAAFDAWKRRASDADILDVAIRLGAKLRKRSREHVGPCPRCGGTDRFGVNTGKQVFNCRGAAGGDVIAMVMHVNALGYLPACEIIVGEPPPAKGTQLTAEALAAAEKAKAESAERAARRDADENLYRDRERRTIFDVFERAHALNGSSAADYLARRGLRFPATQEGRAERIKCVESMPYFLGGNELAKIIHRGPAMIMPIVDAGRKFRGLHLTYLDLAQPKGKLQLADPDKEGALLDAKKTRGSKHGNRVELIGPPAPRRLVLGEGAEKVIAVWQALDDQILGLLPDKAQIGRVAHLQHELGQTAFWSACDLGNLGGKALDTVRHPSLQHASGRAQRVAGAVPDLDAPAIVISDSVEELILLGDSTSDEFTTRLAMCRAAARYAAPGRRVVVAWAPAGLDFDDLWRFAASDEERAAAAAQIVSIVAAAEAPVMPAIAALETIEENPSQERRSSSRRAAARASESEPGAPHDQTGAGDAGAPLDLPDPADVALQDRDPPGDPDAALGPAPPLAAPPPRAGADAKNSKPSRTGGSKKRAGEDRGKWGGGDRDLDGEELDRALAYYPMTDLGNAERCVQRFRRALKYSGAHGWFYWTGALWSTDGADGELLLAEHRTVRGIQDEAAAIEKLAGKLPAEPAAPDRAPADGNVVALADVKAAKKAAREEKKRLKEKRDGMLFLAEALRQHGRESEQSARLSAVGKRAQAYFGVRPAELDADPFTINVANGTLVVRRSWASAGPEAANWEVVNEYIRFKPHDPADLITKQMPVEFDPDAESPLYDEFLEYVQPNADNRRHLHQCGGMCLTGDISEQVMWFNWGKGKNGKSTLFNAWSHVIGDYGRSVAIETFLNANSSRSGAGPSPDLARLEGVRFVRTSEPERGAKLAEALIKLATGGEPMTVRHLNKPIFELLPRFKLVMSGNYRPEVRGTDEGIWRRIKLIPWTVSIPAEKRDRDFGDKLKDEASGILNRLLHGLCDWLRCGLTAPAEIEAATAEYRKDSDPLGRFLDACVEMKEGERVQSTALHQVFCAWCRANGEKEWTATGLGRALAERGFQRRHSDVNYWLNIRMTKAVADFASNEPPPHGEPDSRSQNARAGPPSGDDDTY